jgi:hypothetical protein
MRTITIQEKEDLVLPNDYYRGVIFNQDFLDREFDGNKIIKYVTFLNTNFSKCDLSKYAFYRCNFYGCLFEAYPTIVDKCSFGISNRLISDKKQEEEDLKVLQLRLDNAYTPEEKALVADIIKQDDGKHYGPPSSTKPFIVSNPEEEAETMRKAFDDGRRMAELLKGTNLKVMTDEDFEKIDNDPYSVLIGKAEIDNG